jgi:hypothetical protein
MVNTSKKANDPFLTPEEYEILREQFLTELVSQPVQEVVDDFLTGVYDDLFKYVVVQYIIRSGYRFTRDTELLALKRRHLPNSSLAQLLVTFGYKFTVNELIRIDRDTLFSEGWTAAKIMARIGHIFSVAELKTLDDAYDGHIGRWSVGTKHKFDGWTIAHEMASHGHRFTLAELLELGNPANEYGWTVAHEMASTHYQFTFNDLVALGNPVDREGKAVAHVMISRGYTFSSKELDQLGDPSILQWVEYQKLRLIHENGEPTFSKEESTGRIIFLYSGEAGTDDTYPDIVSHIILSKGDNGWLANSDFYHAYLNGAYYEQAKQILNEMVMKINNALQNGRGADLNEFVQPWLQLDITYGGISVSKEN